MSNLFLQTIERKYRPEIVLIDRGYSHNSTFLQELEKLKLKYIGGLAKNRQATIINPETGDKQAKKRLDEIILLRSLLVYFSILQVLLVGQDGLTYEQSVTKNLKKSQKYLSICQ